jgi:hypothetical protein
MSPRAALASDVFRAYFFIVAGLRARLGRRPGHAIAFQWLTETGPVSNRDSNPPHSVLPVAAALARPATRMFTVVLAGKPGAEGVNVI